jgi:hypothetical protein
MSHYLDLFSPETHAAFSASDRSVSGFRLRHRKAAGRAKPGDLLVCYLTRVSRWFGLLEVQGPPFEDTAPRFVEAEDPFVVRFKVKPLVWLSPQEGIPIHDAEVWPHLSFTKDHDPDSTTWTGAVRTSLARLDPADGRLLEQLLRRQAASPKTYPLEAADQRALQPHKVRRQEGEVLVTVPDDTPEPPPAAASHDFTRESVRVQAQLTAIGAQMGFRVWVPPSDRAGVLREAPAAETSLVAALPLNYDNATLRTIENIDVLWLRGRAIARAFEVEHTTAIYSGILRMADLLALQPNMDIRLHIVAPDARKQKVFDEIRRPVFSLLEGKPLAERCTFLSYDSVQAIATLKHIEHLSDSVLEEYEEEAQG